MYLVRCFAHLICSNSDCVSLYSTFHFLVVSLLLPILFCYDRNLFISKLKVLPRTNFIMQGVKSCLRNLNESKAAFFQHMSLFDLIQRFRMLSVSQSTVFNLLTSWMCMYLLFFCRLTDVDKFVSDNFNQICCKIN